MNNADIIVHGSYLGEGGYAFYNIVLRLLVVERRRLRFARLQMSQRRVQILFLMRKGGEEGDI